MNQDFDFGAWNAQEAPKPETVKGGGGWHWLLTLMSLVIVGGLSFLMAFLTRNVPERPLWLMGLIFVVPMAAMFFSNLFVEFSTSAMTPRFVRGGQMVVAVVATAATFAVGCLCDMIYLNSFVEPVRESTVFVLDKSGSMYSRDGAMVTAVVESLDGMNDNTQVGLVLFDHDVLASMDVRALGEGNHRETLRQKVRNTSTSGGTNFYTAITDALNMIESHGTDQPTQIIFLTDGEDSSFRIHVDDVAARCSALNVKVNAVALAVSGVGHMQSVVDQTGGKTVQVSNTSELTGVMTGLAIKDHDMLRSGDTMAKVMSGVMLVLEGVTIGLGLWLMLSVRGQFRVQIILSPLMGVLALVLLKFLGFDAEAPWWWMVEGAAFSLLGLVFMTKNRVGVAHVNTVRGSNGAGFDLIEDLGLNDSFEQKTDNDNVGF